MLSLTPDPAAKTHAAKSRFLAGDPAYLARYLRSGDDLTPEIREFIAGILEGTIKKKRGPKSPSVAELGKRAWRSTEIKTIYARYKMAADLSGEVTPHIAAVEQVADVLGITESAVHTTIYQKTK